MKKLFRLSAIFVCLSLSNIVLAENASLIIKNNLNDYNVEIKVNLLCGKIKDMHYSARYTSELDGMKWVRGDGKDS